MWRMRCLSLTAARHSYNDERVLLKTRLLGAILDESWAEFERQTGSSKFSLLSSQLSGMGSIKK